MFASEIEADESYFGGHRHGKRGRGAAAQMEMGRRLAKYHHLIIMQSVLVCARTTLFYV